MKKRIVAGLLASAMLLMTACGGETKEKERDSKEKEEEDWREEEDIDLTDCLEIDGDEVYVCAQLGKAQLDLYQDKPKKKLYDSIVFPRELTKDERDNASITIDDTVGDENSDICIDVYDESGLALSWTWEYNGGEFVFCEDLEYPSADIEEPVEDPVVNPNQGQGRVEFEGTYTEPIAGRAWIEITSQGAVDYTIDVNWSGSAYELGIWHMDATYSESEGTLEYYNCEYIIHTTMEDGTTTDEYVYTDGTGRFYFDDEGYLYWESDQSDMDSRTGETAFERVDASAIEPQNGEDEVSPVAYSVYYGEGDPFYILEFIDDMYWRGYWSNDPDTITAGQYTYYEGELSLFDDEGDLYMDLGVTESGYIVTSDGESGFEWVSSL